MNFRERLVLRTELLLKPLLITGEATQVGPTSDIRYLTPKPNYASALQHIFLAPIEEVADTNPMGEITSIGSPIEKLIPVAYVSFDGGRNDGGADASINHLVETLAITIDVVLSNKIGVRDGNRVRPMVLQMSDMLADIQKQVTFANLESAVHLSGDDVTLQEVYLEEWGYNEILLGGSIEVLNMRFECAVGAPHGGG